MAWKYSANQVAVVGDELRVGFKVEGETWVKFGVLTIGLDLLEAEVFRALLKAHQARMEAPVAEDTPLPLSWATHE